MDAVTLHNTGWKPTALTSNQMVEWSSVLTIVSPGVLNSKWDDPVMFKGILTIPKIGELGLSITNIYLVTLNRDRIGLINHPFRTLPLKQETDRECVR